MRRFEVSDHVVLKQDHGLYGYVQRTSSDSPEHDLEDELIIAHVEIPPDVLNEFLKSGIPPPGYVFLQLPSPSAGSCLVHEDDLILLSRCFRLGDLVKQDGSPLTGTVIDIQESYILSPILIGSSHSRSRISPPCTSACPSDLPEHFDHPNAHLLLYDIPVREVQRALDVARDDYIVYGDWVGLVDQVDYDVVILLENQNIVVVDGSHGLYIPVSGYGKPLVALPENDGDKRPHMYDATGAWSTSIPMLDARPGQYVMIDRPQLRNGRWISGSYTANVPSQGFVLDYRARSVSVDWLSGRQGDGDITTDSPSSSHIPIYENIETFRDPGSLRPLPGVIVYDAGKMPARHTCDLVQKNHSVYTGQELGVGMHVKFRDHTAATVKYQGINGTTHGKLFQDEIGHGWDCREFEIVRTSQLATVLWQDGSVTTTDSSSLTEFTLFEPEMSPTDIVLKREGMRQRPVNQKGRATGGIKDFNEMTFFEQPHHLLPTSVGVVQAVDPKERIARVRWYRDPKIELRASGHVLSMESRFGPIGDDIEDVSLYEIMSFPSLLRHRSDMCLISSPKESKTNANKKRTVRTTGDGKATNEATTSSEKSVSAPPRRSVGRRRPTSISPQRPNPIAPDWLGQIVAINLDGSITVRLGALQPCRDLSIDADSILAILDDREHLEVIFATEEYGNHYDPWLDDGSDWSEEEAEPISEIVEYEGGERIDMDSGDDNWVSDEDVLVDAEEDVRDENGDVEMSDSRLEESVLPSAQAEGSLQRVRMMVSPEPPPQFLVLDREPPSDQFGLNSDSAAQASLKRIAKEHKILTTSLPKGEIYVRTYESRLDLMRCLIIGPQDTPYENAPFLIDLYLPERFPAEPPQAYFHSWTSGLGRINPNLYEEGKICLSLLGTWQGKNETERWNEKATILQILVSLQGLVLVKNPFYNEAGFEGYENDKAYTRESEQYSEKAFVMARGFVKHALLRPPGGLEDILAWLYLPRDSGTSTKSLLEIVIERGRLLLDRSDQARLVEDDSLLDATGGKEDGTKVFLKPLSRGASVMLKRSVGELQTRLEEMSKIGAATEMEE